MPWPRDISLIEDLAPVVRQADERGWRIQLLAPPAAEVSSGSAALAAAPLVAYRWDGTSFVGREASSGCSDIATTALGLMSGEDQGDPVRAGLSEVLVCGHGSRDRCCGRYGTLLAAEMAVRAGASARCWRTSHTGGHRFAATAVVLPSGTLWANLDGELLKGIVDKTADPVAAARHYRGCAGLASRELQAVEREVLADLGWELFDHPRSGEELGGGRFRVLVGDVASYEATVRVSRVLPVPVCGEPITTAKKSEVELAVTGLVRVA